MPRIVIRNVAELRQFQSKLKRLKAAFPFIQRKAVTEVSNEVVLDKIHQRMRANDFSEKIIDATFVGPIEINGGISRTHYISNYVDPDTNFDVSNAREEGTIRGDVVRPKKPDGSLRIPGPFGNVIFAKSARPGGIERLLIIEKTIKEAENDVKFGIADSIGSESAKILGV